MSATVMFSSRWLIEDVPGIKSTSGRRSSSPASATWAGVQRRRGGGGRTRRAGRDRVAAAGEAGAERKERHESDAAGVALLEYRHGPPVGQVQQVLHAGDVGDGQRPAQVAGRDVAE